MRFNIFAYAGILAFFPSLLAAPPKSGTAPASKGNQQISSFKEAKKIAARIHEENPITIYCPCRYHGKNIDLKSCGYRVHKNSKRARRLEWEHVVPAESFGQSFVEWREGSPTCRKRGGKSFKGRKCAGTNAEFARMEADLYNLWPSIGELNGLRSNFSMAAIAADSRNPPLTFGGCQAKISDRKFEPMEQYKGIVARTYFYMDATYPGHGVVSEKNRKLFEAWDHQHPPDSWECRRAKLIADAQGNVNTVLRDRCQTAQNPVKTPLPTEKSAAKSGSN